MEKKYLWVMLLVGLALVIAIGGCLLQARSTPTVTVQVENTTQPAPSLVASATKSVAGQSNTALPPFTATSTIAALIITPTSTTTISPTVLQVQPTISATLPEGPTATTVPATPVPQVAEGAGSSVESHSVMGIELYKMDDSWRIDLAHQAGAYWIRRNALLWSEVEPVEGQRNWAAVAELEQELINASARGFQAILIVRSTPEWAQKVPGILCGPIKADKLSAFADFMLEAVARYSAPPFNVHYWEIGNEPDVDYNLVPSESIFGCWGDAADAQYGGGYYAEMLKVVYPKVKIADAQSQVLIGGLLLDCDPVNPPETSAGSGEYKNCAPSRFLEGILQNGGGDYFDGVSYHAYENYGGAYGKFDNGNWHSSWDTTGPVLGAKTSYIRSLLNVYGLTNKYLMNTEVALMCGRTGSEAICLSDDFLKTQSIYVVKSYVMALAEGLKANIWYNGVGWRATSLWDTQGTTFPSYISYQFVASQLQGAQFVKEVDQFPGVKGYEFTRNNQRFWVLWSLDGAEHTVQLDSSPIAMSDVSGNGLATDVEIKITLAPIYILW